MKRVTKSIRRENHASGMLPAYVQHRSFATKAASEYDPKPLLADDTDYASSYMPDDVTRQYAKAMHYAAHRMRVSSSAADRRKWRGHYHALRDRIVVGNRKLVYRAVQRRMAAGASSDDLIGECHIVLLHATAAYNPWLGIRFSTYAYTCLVRALSRQAQKQQRDWLSRACSFDAFPDNEPSRRLEIEPSSGNGMALEQYLRDDHPLLTDREKAILSRRFSFKDVGGQPTLARVGRAVGLSKERVRQLQTGALEKLRTAILHS